MNDYSRLNLPEQYMDGVCWELSLNDRMTGSAVPFKDTFV